MRELEWSYPKLSDFQREWLDDPHRFKIIEGATGTGKTFVYEPSLFQKAHAPQQRGDEYWWIAPTIDQARAGDIIARAQVYFTGSNRDVPALMDAIRTIAKGNDTVLNAA